MAPVIVPTNMSKKAWMLPIQEIADGDSDFRVAVM
jgi:hypothetical protein